MLRSGFAVAALLRNSLKINTATATALHCVQASGTRVRVEQKKITCAIIDLLVCDVKVPDYCSTEMHQQLFFEPSPAACVTNGLTVVSHGVLWCPFVGSRCAVGGPQSPKVTFKGSLQLGDWLSESDVSCNSQGDGANS